METASALDRRYRIEDRRGSPASIGAGDVDLFGGLARTLTICSAGIVRQNARAISGAGRCGFAYDMSVVAGARFTGFAVDASPRAARLGPNGQFKHSTPPSNKTGPSEGACFVGCGGPNPLIQNSLQTALRSADFLERK